MSDKAKKWILWGSIFILLLSIGGIVYSTIIPYSDTVDIFQITSIMVVIASVLNMIFLLANKFQSRKGFRKVIWIMTCFLPVVILLLFAYDFKWITINSDLLYSLLLSGILILIPVATMYLFVLDDTKTIMGISIILFYTILSLVLKRFNLGDAESLLNIGLLLISCGMYFFGLKCFFSIKKNRFLKAVSIIACLLIYFGCFIMMYSSFTYTNTILIIYSISIFLLTLIVLISLPVSGYIQWSTQHKSLLRKILIPWIFFLLLISIRFVFPDLNSLFFREVRGGFQEFRMNDYPVINKNGLEP
ncbi:MAG: hypothetical protein NTW82_09655 [Bacteroidia bacterium]|nr:hypothetical protein [Bacteroidia bacterium]